MFDALRACVRTLVRRDIVAAEMEEELRDHLEESERLLLRRGMSPDEARVAARQALGNTTMLAEDARAARGGTLFDDLRRDVQYGIRALTRTPGFTAVVVVTLALGFGVNGALFAVLKRAMSPSSIPQADTWLYVNDLWSWDEYRQLSQDSRALKEWSASVEETVLLAPETEAREPETIRALFVTDGYFPALRGRAESGRVFSQAEVAPPVGIPTVVLSHAIWKRRFNEDSSIVGRDVFLANGQPFRVIGVMPRLFTGTSLRPPDIWLPLGTRARLPFTGSNTEAGTVSNWFGANGTPFLFIHARLAPDATVEAARSELRLRIEQVASRGDSTRGRDAAANAHLATESGINGAGEMAGVFLVLGAGFSVLLIASVTVANLMLARAASRRREMGVRLALGASRFRVIRSWMTECFLLSAAAAALGLLLAWWTMRAIVMGSTFTSLAENVDPTIMANALAPDAWVFVYLVLISIPCALVFGFVPALHVTRQDPLATIRSGGGSGATQGTERVFLRRGLVVSQIALTTLLLLASAMMVDGVQVASSIDPGFDRKNVLAVSPTLVHSGYDSLRAERFMEEFLSRLTTIPGVTGLTRGSVPMEDQSLALIARPDEQLAANVRFNGSFNAVDENYFEVLGIDLLRGRMFTRAEVSVAAPVAIIPERTAETYWPGEEAIGKVISIKPLSRTASKSLPEGIVTEARVIGVVRDARMSTLRTVDRRYVYLPGDAWTPMLRTNGDPAVVQRVRAMTRLIDPNVVVHVRSLEEAIWKSSGWLESAKLLTGSATGMGLLSLLMAVVGLFGLTAYAVEQRTREFGVRMALGAGTGQVVRLVTKQSLQMVAVGALIGVVASFGSAGLLRAALFGVSGNDPLVYFGVVLLLGAVTVLACWIPARRATRVDPMIALRTD